MPQEDAENAGNAEEIRRKLSLPISSLSLSMRARNCLEGENIKTVGDLVTKSVAEMIKVRNFGKTSLVEIKKKLGEMGLSLGMDLSRIQNGKGKIE